MRTNRHLQVAGTWLFAFTILTTGTTAALAGESHWQHAPATPGDWFEPTNWTSGVPGSYDYAYVNNGGTAEISLYDAKAYALYSGFEANSGGIVHNSGRLDVNQVFYLGYYSDAVGSYTLLNTGELNFYNGLVGSSGTGRFEQYGGTNFGNFLYIGSESGSNGLYELSEGNLRVTNNVVVGQQGTGRFVQTGGVFQMGGYNWMGDRPGSTGIFELHGGELDSGTLLYIGASGTGKFIHTGGIHDAHILDIGWSWNEPAQGTYLLSGTGELSACCVDLGSSTSTGTFIQTGGTNYNSGYVSIRNGSYTISSGSFITPRLQVGPRSDIDGVLNITGSTAEITIQEELSLECRSVLKTVPGATIHMTGSAFVNQSTDPEALAGLKNLRLIFEGGSTDIDPFEVAGQDKGANWEAFHNNFTLGTLQLGGADVGQVQLVDNYDNQPGWEGIEAQYVRNLTLSAGSQLNLNGLNLYCLNFVNDGGQVIGGQVTQVPPIESINATYLDSGFIPTGGEYGNGELTVSDQADIVVESAAGQTTYDDGSVGMATSLFDDNSADGLASGVFHGGELIIRDSANADLLAGDMIELELHEVIDGAGLLAGQGLFEVTGGSLEEAFYLPLGQIVQITFEIDPADIDDFSAAFTGVSNITLTPIPEPATLSLLAVGTLAILLHRKK